MKLFILLTVYGALVSGHFAQHKGNVQMTRNEGEEKDEYFKKPLVNLKHSFSHSSIKLNQPKMQNPDSLKPELDSSNAAKFKDHVTKKMLPEAHFTRYLKNGIQKSIPNLGRKINDKYISSSSEELLRQGYSSRGEYFLHGDNSIGKLDEMKLIRKKRMSDKMSEGFKITKTLSKIFQKMRGKENSEEEPGNTKSLAEVFKEIIETAKRMNESQTNPKEDDDDVARYLLRMGNLREGNSEEFRLPRSLMKMVEGLGEGKGQSEGGRDGALLERLGEGTSPKGDAGLASSLMRLGEKLHRAKVDGGESSTSEAD